MAARYRALARSTRPAFNSFKTSSPSVAVNTPLSSRRNPLENHTSRFRSPFTSSARLPAELGCVMSMMPLHNVVAAARMTSRLSVNSLSSCALTQGTLCCTSPDR